MASSTQASAPARRSLTDRFLHIVEVGGNALPHPATLFALLTLCILVGSWLAVRLDVSALHPATHEVIRPVDLLSREGLHRLLTGLVPNFTGFAPLGAVLVSLIGIGVAEHSGLIGAALRRLVFAAPAWALTPVVVFAGVMSNMASEIGYVLLIPSLVVFGVFVFWPLVHNAYLGFYRNPPFPGLPSTYVGFDQYKDVLTSETFVDSVKTTFLFAIMTVPVGIALGLGLAILAHQQLKGIGIYRTFFS